MHSQQNTDDERKKMARLDEEFKYAVSPFRGNLHSEEEDEEEFCSSGAMTWKHANVTKSN